MDNQYTPTYHRLWNHEFVVLLVAEMLLCLSCYMTVPTLPFRLLAAGSQDINWALMTMAAFVVGMCLSGLFGCWLIQRYRRNKVFFLSACLLAACIFAFSLLDMSANYAATPHLPYVVLATCTASGCAFGSAKRVLSCTLLIDKTESCNRTEANYVAIWIARMTVVAGPVATISLRHEMPNTWFYGTAAAIALASATLVMSVKFPFRAPEEGTHIISFDRFFLPKSWNVALVITLMAASLGIVISTRFNLEVLSSIAAGFVISILVLRYNVVRTGRFTSAVGNACMLAALAAFAFHDGLLDNTLKPMILGLGFGLTSSEQLFKLLNQCDHCQRSTAESTYFMSSDSGLFFGIATGICLTQTGWQADHTALACLVVAVFICSVNALVKRKRTAYHA